MEWFGAQADFPEDLVRQKESALSC